MLHAKKSCVNICFALYFQYLCTEILEPDSCCSHAKLLCSPGPVPLTLAMTFPALLYHPWSSFPTSTLNRNTCSNIARLLGSDRMVLDLLNGYCLWQAAEGKNLHLLYRPLNSYSHSFCNCWLYWSQGAVENSRRQLSSQEFWSEKKATAENWQAVDESVRQGQTSSFQALHWTVAYLNTWLASRLLRQISLSSFKIKALSAFVDLPNCM